MTNLTIYEE